MEVSLTPAAAQRIRAALGEDVALSPDVIPVILARLAVEAPAVYSDVLAEISGSQIKLDSEQELERRRRRSLLRRFLFWWGEYETTVGDRLPAKRRIAAAVPIGIACLTLALLILSSMISRTSRYAPHLVASVRNQERSHVPSGRQTKHIMARQPATLAFPKDATPIPTPRLSAVVTPLLPSVPISVEYRDPGARPQRNPIVIGAPTDAPPNNLGPLSTPVVYQRHADQQNSRTVEEDRISNQSENASASVDLPAGTGREIRLDVWTEGARVPARLVTGLVVLAGGGPTPVVVETTDPPGTWLGEAVLGPDNLVHISLTLARKDRSRLVRGIALDPDHLTPGLVGRMSVRHPYPASMVATAAIQAAGEYMQTIGRQNDTNMASGLSALAISQPVSSWTDIATRLAQEFNSRGANGTWVTTAEIPIGSRLDILLTEAL